MYSGKIAVPPGGGGKQLISFDNGMLVSRNKSLGLCNHTHTFKSVHTLTFLLLIL
jgi:hypothetical protein